MARGVLIAAPASGSGKTTVTLGLLRWLRNQGLAAASVKIGPDYIDPAFHAAAAGRPCLNLDSWAMRRQTLAAAADQAGAAAELIVGEGVMGLFDGAADGTGSTAEMASLSGWPVVLLVDAAGMGASVAALVEGFARHRSDLEIAGVICNRVGSARHAKLLTDALRPLGIPLLGCLPKCPDLILPSRHLGLVQASEHADLEAFLEEAAGWVGANLDWRRLVALARPACFDGAPESGPQADPSPLPPLGRKIAVARDRAFAFAYPLLLEGWRKDGAVIEFFSPLADQAPGPDCDAVYLPGGYPELSAGDLAAAQTFMAGLRAAGARGAVVYGECGGYMMLGQGLIDAQGRRHAMAGLLPHETSFADRRRSLGYRSLKLLSDGPLGMAGAGYRGHEFHYATLAGSDRGEPWLRAWDSAGEDQGPLGSRAGAVFGSFLHLIDREADGAGRHLRQAG